MGTYNKVITRDDAEGLVADQKIIDEIIKGVTEQSSILPLMRKLPNMTSKTASLAVLSALPEAYCVEGDTGLKQTTNAMWKNKKLTAEEIAVVVPIPENVLNDSEYDIWGEIKPLIIQEIYKKVDSAIITGVDAPTSWTDALIPTITAKGNVLTYDANATTYERLSDAMSLVEEDGFDVTGLVGGVKLKGELRKGLVDSTGQPLSASEVTELPKVFAKNGAWDETQAQFIVGDFKQAVYSIRQDIDFKVFDSGVVTDNEGKILYNLMQQDMVALRVTFRIGFALPNAVT
jgi:HK97 family phage major capsid protein